MYFEIYRQATGLIGATSNGGGDWRWRLKAPNNRTIANSGEGYSNRKDCIAAIDLVKGTNQTTQIKEK